jgi:hypothetical protein
MRKVITCTWLESQGACKDELERFRAEFGERLPINEKNLQRLAKGDYQIGWLAFGIFVTTELYFKYCDKRLQSTLPKFEARNAEAFWCVWEKYKDAS